VHVQGAATELFKSPRRLYNKKKLIFYNVPKKTKEKRFPNCFQKKKKDWPFNIFFSFSRLHRS